MGAVGLSIPPNGGRPNRRRTGEDDLVHVEDNCEEVELDDIYIDRILVDENEMYDAYNSYSCQKSLKFTEANY